MRYMKQRLTLEKKNIFLAIGAGIFAAISFVVGFLLVCALSFQEFGSELRFNLLVCGFVISIGLFIALLFLGIRNFIEMKREQHKGWKSLGIGGCCFLVAFACSYIVVGTLVI